LLLLNSDSPDIPRDKVSPKNKMPNILYLLYWMPNDSSVHYVIRKTIVKKFKKWRSTILPISTKRTTTSDLKSLNTKKTTTYGVRKPCPGCTCCFIVCKFGITMNIVVNLWTMNNYIVGTPLIDLTPPHCCACPKPGHGFLTP
jgi:hypothetical protein